MKNLLYFLFLLPIFLFGQNPDIYGTLTKEITTESQRFTFSGAVLSLDATHTPAGSLINVNDTIFQFFRYAPNGDHIDTSGRIVFRTSIDAGLTWTTPTTVYDSVAIDDRNVQAGYFEGVLYVWFRRYNITSGWYDCGYMTSTNSGSTWSAYAIWEASNFIPSTINGKNTVDSTFMMLYTTGKAKLVSSPDGINWNISQQVYNFPADTLYYEPTFTFVGDTIICLIRQEKFTNQSGVYQTVSLNGGNTWSALTPTNLVNETENNINPTALYYDSTKNVIIAVTGSRIEGDYAIYTYFASPADVVADPTAWILLSRKPVLWDRSYGYPTITNLSDTTWLVIYTERATAFHLKDVATFFQFDINYNTTEIKGNAVSRYDGLSATLNNYTGNIDQSALPETMMTLPGKISNKATGYVELKATANSDTILYLADEFLDPVMLVLKTGKTSWYKQDYSKVAEMDTVGQIGGFQVVWDTSHVNTANKKQDMWVYDRADAKIYRWNGTYWNPFLTMKATGNMIFGDDNLTSPSSSSNTIFGTNNFKLSTVSSVRNTVIGRSNLPLATQTSDNFIGGFDIAPIATGMIKTTALGRGVLTVVDTADGSIHIGNTSSALLKKSFSSIAIGDRSFRNVKYALLATQIGPGTVSNSLKDSLINTVIIGGDIVFSNYGKTATKYTDEVILGNNNGEVAFWWQESGLLTLYDAAKAATLIINPVASGLGIKLGGETNAFPFIKKNSTGIDIKLADDSGYTTLTAYLRGAAGSAAAGTAPLKLTTGTNNTVAESGAIEYDGTEFYATNSTPVRGILPRVLKGSATLDFGVTLTLTSSELTITVTGAAEGDIVSLGIPNASATANSGYTARVSATDTVSIKFNNYSAISIDPASGTFKVAVMK